jgi:RHS repeat-associated protein
LPCARRLSFLEPAAGRETEGRRRNIDWTALAGSVSDAYPWQSQLVTRGYTFHEQLDPIGLVHMNGRVYDAEIGRFLSADAVIQDISNSQALNAYSYVQNNPLSFTDPSGFFLSGLFHKIGNFFRSVAHAIGRVVRSSVFRSVLTILACATPGVNVVACAAMAATISFGGALVDGGSFGDAIRSASVAFFSAGLFQGGGDFLQGLGLGGNIFARAAVQGTIGGAMSVMGGGSFSAGFYSNAFGAVANGFTEGLGDAGFGRIGRIAIAAAAGGTASVLAGGKFANGAMSAAFALMYNDMQHAAAWGAAGTAVGAAGGLVAGGGLAVLSGGPGGFAIPETTYLGGLVGGAIGTWIGSVYDTITNPFGGAVYNSEGGNKDPSTPTGQRGNPMHVPAGTNEDATIGGREYGGHSLDQMQGRGVPPSAVEDTIQNGQQSPGNVPGRIVHTGPDIRVITQGGGRVITVIPR